MLDRPETDTMQFGNDWPGVFIRGDNAASYAWAIRLVLEKFGKDMHPIMEKAILEGLQDLLMSSNTHSNPKPQLLKSFEECKCTTSDTEERLTKE